VLGGFCDQDSTDVGDAARLVAAIGSAVSKVVPGRLGDALTALQVHLQEGFQDDEVVLLVDGAERLHEREVTTKLLLGMADTKAVEVAPGRHEIEVRVPTRGLQDVINVTVASQPVQLGLSIQDERLAHIVQEGKSFGYL
jgi:hypothetical protein